MNNKAETLFDELESFRIGKTTQNWIRNNPPSFENKYIKLLRIDSSNKKGGESVIHGKQWSIIFELKLPFTELPGWKTLCAKFCDDVKITPVTKGALNGCFGIRFYHMSSDPTNEIILDILDFIFFSI